MNQLTTIASLPSGGGCKASLPAEKAEPRELFFKADWEELAACWPGNPLLHEKLGELGYCVKDGVIERLPEYECLPNQDSIRHLKTGAVVTGLQIMGMSHAMREELMKKVAPQGVSNG